MAECSHSAAYKVGTKLRKLNSESANSSIINKIKIPSPLFCSLEDEKLKIKFMRMFIQSSVVDISESKYFPSILTFSIQVKHSFSQKEWNIRFFTLVGLLNPLDAPHHLRQDEMSEFREGIVLDRPVKSGCGSFVNAGLKKVKISITV